jgi:hypothetical protein
MSSSAVQMNDSVDVGLSYVLIRCISSVDLVNVGRTEN